MPKNKTTRQSKQWGYTVQIIIEAFKTCGPMTRTELCRYINADRNTTAAVVSRMLRASPKHPKRVYIKAYVYDQEGERYYPRAVYDLGDKADAKKPKANPMMVKRKYLERKRLRFTTNSVFNLARSTYEVQMSSR